MASSNNTDSEYAIGMSSSVAGQLRWRPHSLTITDKHRSSIFVSIGGATELFFGVILHSRELVLVIADVVTIDYLTASTETAKLQRGRHFLPADGDVGDN